MTPRRASAQMSGRVRMPGAVIATATGVYGTVTQAPQIDKVGAIVKGVPGVKSTTNKLAVQRPIGE
jgi:hypothetical protein